MKLSNILHNSAKTITKEGFKKIEEKELQRRLLGKKSYGWKKLEKDLYEK